MDATQIDALVEAGNWFPFVETWSALGPKEMFDNLVKSAYGSGSINSIPKIRIEFSRGDFNFSIPDRFCRPYPALSAGTQERSAGFAILTHDIDNKDYREMNALGEFYMEDLRLSSSKRRFKSQTPIEIWDQERKHIVELARRQAGPNAGPYDIRNAVFSYTKESNPFRPTVALAVYSLFQAKNILDMSSGWGDRLLGALAWSVRRPKQQDVLPLRYQGFDPFAELQPRYAAMINDFKLKDSEDTFTVTCAPFEEASLDESFDLAFTSPPYFDFEEYGISPGKRRDTQSTVRFPQLGDWVQGFLKPMMKKAARALRVGGHLAINIEGPFMYKLLDSELFGRSDREAVGERPLRMEYQGIVGYRSNEPRDRFTHPIFIWRRSA